MRIGYLTFLAFNLNGAIDTGKYGNVTYREVADHVDAGTIFDFLGTRLAKDIDLSIFDAERKTALVAEWQDMRGVDARRKFGVENNGLCLLMAYCLEGIQRRQDANPQP